MLNLQPTEARTTVAPSDQSPQAHYIRTLADALELLISEDENLFEQYEARYHERVDALRKERESAAQLFALAEIRMQWAFVYLKFGHEFDAVWNIRQANQLVQHGRKRYPQFSWYAKTSGLLNILLGAVPEKYQWVLSLLNMTGSIDKGLAELRTAGTTGTDLALESRLLLCLVDAFMLQQHETALAGLQLLLSEQPDNRLLLFLGAALAIKNSESEKALGLLQSLHARHQGLPLPYANYLTAEVYLHKGDYAQAIAFYQKFLHEYKGLNYRKDAWYKTGVCQWLTGNDAAAQESFAKARTEGKEAIEADKYAARSLAESTLPSRKVSRIRYSTDGGYYEEALALVRTVEEADLPNLKDKVEFTYRQARLYHKLNRLPEAKEEYRKTIVRNGDEPWYFAPNACLQLGYIFQEENNLTEARNYFEKAIAYKRHEYKNSIDAKAKSALASLSGKKK